MGAPASPCHVQPVTLTEVLDRVEDRKFILATDTVEEKAEWEAALNSIKRAAPEEQKKKQAKEALDAAVRLPRTVDAWKSEQCRSCSIVAPVPC